MTKRIIEKELLLTYIDYISQAQPSLGNLPICPYTKKFADKIEYHFSDDLEKALDYQYDFYPHDIMIVLLVNSDINKYSVEVLQNLIEENALKFAKKDLWIAYDHPDQINVIGDVRTSNKHFAMILVQPLTELVRLSHSLHKTPYYDSWTKEYYEEIVAERKKLLERK